MCRPSASARRRVPEQLLRRAEVMSDDPTPTVTDMRDELAAPSSASGSAASGALPTACLADLRDRRVEDDVRVAKRQLTLLRELVDLIVLDEQDARRSGLPRHEELLPERVVVALARLRAEHRQLPGCGFPLDEV